MPLISTLAAAVSAITAPAVGAAAAIGYSATHPDNGDAPPSEVNSISAAFQQARRERSLSTVSSSSLMEAEASIPERRSSSTWSSWLASSSSPPASPIAASGAAAIASSDASTSSAINPSGNAAPGRRMSFGGYDGKQELFVEKLAKLVRGNQPPKHSNPSDSANAHKWNREFGVSLSHNDKKSFPGS
ncbi:hypothetical protein GQ42DRAFT_163290, partial [Ramicandelaber brevisporus]